MEKIKNYINGGLVAPISNQYIDNYNPATGEVYSQVPDSDERDVAMAVVAAEKAFPKWSVMPAEERSRLLLRVAQLIEQNREKLALAESIDNGKPVWLAKSVDIPRAAGNCVVGKPSEITPMTAYMLSELCLEAGLPPGVLNIVHGYGHKVGAAIAAHPKVPVITFTGRTPTGAEIAKTAAPLFKKLSLEMGGKNPNIIFADCNYEEMIQTTLRSSFVNQGEICLCGSRIFVERLLYEKFRNDFVT